MGFDPDKALDLDATWMKFWLERVKEKVTRRKRQQGR
jgi:hypothetical protein